MACTSLAQSADDFVVVPAGAALQSLCCASSRLMNQCSIQALLAEPTVEALDGGVVGRFPGPTESPPTPRS